MKRDGSYLTCRESEREREKSAGGNPLEILGVESGGAKAEGPRCEGARGKGGGEEGRSVCEKSGSEKVVAGT